MCHLLSCFQASAPHIALPALQVIPQLRQVFERISLSSTKALASSDCAASDPGGGGGSVAAEADARLEHFKRTAWPRLKEGASAGGQLVYVPSYFDFVR